MPQAAIHKRNLLMPSRPRRLWLLRRQTQNSMETVRGPENATERLRNFCKTLSKDTKNGASLSSRRYQENQRVSTTCNSKIRSMKFYNLEGRLCRIFHCGGNVSLLFNVRLLPSARSRTLF